MPKSEANCIFCKVRSGEIPSEKIYEDELVFVIRDVKPLAPVHLLVIPNEHIQTLLDVPDERIDLLSHMLDVARKMAIREGISKKGFRILINTNSWGGQVVFHLHLHVIGGKPLKG
ncbi:MAG: histidine triad nucleotide-binding protein [Candidatus Alcyoniella australis]|nr:histidine triad nucleotide-binding protein [Candidatus Alcyoniella australis]